MIKSFSLLFLVIVMTGCASVPVEEPVSVTIDAPATQTRTILIDTFFEKFPEYRMQLVKADDYRVEFRMECSEIASPLYCAGMLLSVGNSGWQGPYVHMEFIALDIDGQTKLRANAKYCAINMAGMQNCMPADGEAINGMNDILLGFQSFMENRN